MQKKLLQTTILFFLLLSPLFWANVSYGQNPVYIHNFPPETPPGILQLGNGLGNFPNILNTDHFGSSVCDIGDLDGDGVDDLAIGAYSDNTTTGTTGCVYIVFMASDGTVKKILGVPQYVKNSVPTSQNFGISVANIGDINGDGINDIAVGANADPSSGGIKFTGQVYICLLKKNGTFSSTNAIAGASMPGWINSAAQGPIQFGWSVAGIGDVNGDGVNDIVVGAPQDKSGNGGFTGSAFVIFLDKTGAVKTGTTPVRIDKNNNTGYLIPGDQFGSSVAGIGDFDGDGIPDIAIGASLSSVTNAKCGAVYIINLNKTGVPKSGAVKISNNTTALSGLFPASEYFGSSLAYLKDFRYGPSAYRPKGVKVLAVGAYNDNDYLSGAGAVWLIYFDSGTSNVLYYQKISGTNAAIKTNATLSKGNGFGYAICNYDNRDSSSTQRIVVGLPFDPGGLGTPNTGIVDVLDFRKFDVQMDTIIAPGDTICANSNQNIAVVYENKSNQATYGFNIKVDVTGAGTFSQNQYLKKKDSVGQKDTAIFTVNFPTSAPGTYFLKAHVQMNGDFDPLNDTIVGETYVLKSLTVPNFGKDTVYLCQGTTVPLDLLNSGSGATYSWYKDSVFVSDTETYTVRTTGNYIGIAKIGGCSSSDTIQVNYRKSASVKLGPDQIICYGDSTSLDAGYPDATHQWYNITDPSNIYSIDTNQVIEINNNTSAKYRATVAYISHGGQCLYADTININYNHVIVDLGPDSVLCVGQKYLLDAQNPGSKYKWAKDGIPLADTMSTFNDSISGTYSVIVQNGNCFGFDTVMVTFLSVPSVSLSPNFDTLCANGTRLLNAGNPGYKHYWEKYGVPLPLADTVTQYTVTDSGYYSVLVANSQRAKCNATDAATITYNLLSVTVLNTPSITLCQGTTQVLNAKVKSTVKNTRIYQWYKDGNQVGTGANYTVAAAGKYWVVVNVGHCSTTSDTLEVFYTPIVQPNFGNSDTLLCQGTSITLDAANAGAGYDWTTPRGTKTSEQVTVDTAGYYSVTVKNAACTQTNFIRVKYTDINIALGSDTTLCYGRPVPLDAKNTFYFDPLIEQKSTYQWFENGSAISGATSQVYYPTTPGTYQVVVYQKYCLDSGSINVNFLPSPIVYHLDTTICNNDSIILDAGNPGSKVYWYPHGDTTHQIKIYRTISPTAIRHYKAYVTNGSCTDTSYFNIGFYDSVYFKNWRPEIYLCDSLKNGVTLDAGAAVTYDWEPTGDQTRLEDITTPGKYTIKITNIGGCSRMDSVHVYECPESDLLIPNVFTPNKDDVNDSFRIYNLNSQEYLLTIYNRWGEQIFSSTNPDKAWDGTFEGAAAPEGVYAWTLVYRLKTAVGTPPRKIVSGTLMLLRP